MMYSDDDSPAGQAITRLLHGQAKYQVNSCMRARDRLPDHFCNYYLSLNIPLWDRPPTASGMFASNERVEI